LQDFVNFLWVLFFVGPLHPRYAPFLTYSGNNNRSALYFPTPTLVVRVTAKGQALLKTTESAFYLRAHRGVAHRGVAHRGVALLLLHDH